MRDEFGRERVPHGENPPPGAIIYYNLGSEPSGEVKISILDGGGNLVQSYSSSASARDPFSKTTPVGTAAGLNRFVWDLRYPGPEAIPDHVLFMHPPPTPPVGALALPGSYTVRIDAEGVSLNAPLEVKQDPRVLTDAEELRSQFDFHQQLVDSLSTITRTVLEIRRLKDELAALQQRATKLDTERVATASKNLEEKLAAIEGNLIEPRMQTGGDASGAGGDAFHYPIKLDNKLSILIGWSPTPTAPRRNSRTTFTTAC